MTSCYALGHYFKKASELRHYQISASYPDVSLSVSMHVKQGAKEKKGLASSFFTFPWSLALRHQSLACHSRFALASMRKTKHLRRRRRRRRRRHLSIVLEPAGHYCDHWSGTLGLLFLIIGSFRVLISRNAFEWRTPTASEPFSPLISLDAPNLYG